MTSRTTKAMLKAAIEQCNVILKEAGSKVFLADDGGAYGQGPQLYWSKAETNSTVMERTIGNRQRISIQAERLTWFERGMRAITSARIEAKKQYGICPICGGFECDPIERPTDWQDGTLTGFYRCDECRATWQIGYEVTGIQNVRER